jgi:hypothetical protein
MSTRGTKGAQRICHFRGVSQRLTPSSRRTYIELDLPLLIDSAFAAGAAMISFGAVLGKVSPAQITFLLLLQVPIYAFNAHLATEVRKTIPHHIPQGYLVPRQPCFIHRTSLNLVNDQCI